MLQHPYRLGAPLTILNAVAGAAAIYINWDSDHQRQVSFRGTLASATCVHCGDKCMWILPRQTLKHGSPTRRSVAADVPGNGRQGAHMGCQAAENHGALHHSRRHAKDLAAAGIR